MQSIVITQMHYLSFTNYLIYFIPLLEGIDLLMKYNYLDRSKTMPIKELNSLAFIIFITIKLLNCPIIKVLIHYSHKISFNLIINCIPVMVKYYSKS